MKYFLLCLLIVSCTNHSLEKELNPDKKSYLDEFIVKRAVKDFLDPSVPTWVSGAPLLEYDEYSLFFLIPHLYSQEHVEGDTVSYLSGAAEIGHNEGRGPLRISGTLGRFCYEAVFRIIFKNDQSFKENGEDYSQEKQYLISLYQSGQLEKFFLSVQDLSRDNVFYLLEQRTFGKRKSKLHHEVSAKYKARWLPVEDCIEDRIDFDDFE